MMPDPRETYEADMALCETCGEPFAAASEDPAPRRCPGCDDWSDMEGYFY